MDCSPLESDVRLVQRAQAGEASAFATLVGRHWRRVHAQAFRRLRCDTDAEEVAQDTFLCAHRALGRFRGDCAFASWIYRIAANLSHNRDEYWRRRQRGRCVSMDAVAPDEPALSERLATSQPGPREALLTGELADAIHRLAGQLSADQQRVLWLRNGQDGGYDGIAAHLGVSVGTVKSRLARARKRLRALLANEIAA